MAMLFYALVPLKLPSPKNIKAKQQQQQQHTKEVFAYFIYMYLNAMPLMC